MGTGKFDNNFFFFFLELYALMGDFLQFYSI